MELLNFIRTRSIVRSGLLAILFSLVGAVQGQTDVIPSSVDLRLVQGASNDQLKIQMKIYSTAGFGGILSALTVTIRYDAASGASLGPGTSFCNSWSPFNPSPVVIEAGVAYRTYNGFGLNRIEDPIDEGGCETILQPGEWFTITTIPVVGEGCFTFTMGNDAYTYLTNRDYYVSMGGNDLSGVVTSGPLDAGNCAFDCLGVSGGTALPGTPCDDGDPNTNDDTWTADCECVGTVCDVPLISGTTNNAPLCSGNTLELGVQATGTQPLSYAWTGSGTFDPNGNSQSVNVTGASTGDYQVTVSNACGSAQATVPVVVNTPPSATIEFPASPYCTTSFTDMVTRTGSEGGTYSASPTGLAFDTNSGAIDPASSSAGTYTVTYGIPASGGCAAFSTTTTLVITDAPSATIAYAASPYCISAGSVNVTRAGSSNGTYSASPTGLSINANSGAIDAASSDPGSYTVTYSIAASGGCAAFSTTASVEITSSPSATIAYATSPYCTTAGTVSVTRTGATNGTYTATPSGLSINANSGAINAASSDEGTYTVTYSIAASGGCAAFSTTAQVSIEEATTWYADTDGDGVGDDADTSVACEQPSGYVAVGGDLCPTDPDKLDPGVCGCGIPDVDTDLDGIPNCIDSCPSLPGEVGDACDDGDPATEDDVITEDCICEGTLSTGVVQVDAGVTHLVLYPNPNSTHRVNVELPGSTGEKPVSIEVRDITGRIILQTIATATGDRGQIVLDLPRNIGAGNYSVQLIANGQRYVERLVIY